jgi:hypothetical protein
MSTLNPRSRYDNILGDAEEGENSYNDKPETCGDSPISDDDDTSLTDSDASSDDDDSQSLPGGLPLPRNQKGLLSGEEEEGDLSTNGTSTSRDFSGLVQAEVNSLKSLDHSNQNHQTFTKEMSDEEALVDTEQEGSSVASDSDTSDSDGGHSFSKTSATSENKNKVEKERSRPQHKGQRDMMDQYRKKLDEDPSFTPTIGRFWEHDNRDNKSRGGRGRGRG